MGLISTEEFPFSEFVYSFTNKSGLGNQPIRYPLPKIV